MTRVIFSTLTACGQNAAPVAGRRGGQPLENFPLRHAKISRPMLIWKMPCEQLESLEILLIWPNKISASFREKTIQQLSQKFYLLESVKLLAMEKFQSTGLRTWHTCAALRQIRSVWSSLIRALVVSKLDYCNSVLAAARLVWTSLAANTIGPAPLARLFSSHQ